MTDATAEFFDELAKRGHEPLLAKATGTVRFDRQHAGKEIERWLVTLDEGRHLGLAQERGAADSRRPGGPARLFDGIASGKMNAMAAMLRGADRRRRRHAAAGRCSSGSSRFRRAPGSAARRLREEAR